jgi:hypothetical protein
MSRQVDLLAEMRDFMRTPSFLIWSNEHGAWWGPNGCGYTKRREEAGRYVLFEALRIVFSANRYIRGETPNELMCFDWGKGVSE